MARPHMSLIHPGFSTLLLMEYASADKVDRTTRDIFFEVQFSGVVGAGLFLLRSLFVAQINVPWKDARFEGPANEASPRICV